jgi:hypothetical protein
MFTEDDLVQLLQGYGISILNDCFLLWDERTQLHSVGYFDAARRPQILFIDDAVLEARLTEYLQTHGVKAYRTLAEIKP